MILHPARRELTDGAISLRLTRRETAILSALAKSPCVVEYSHLISAVWDIDLEPEDAFNALKVFVSKLRAKIRDAGIASPIVTVWGRGFRLSDPVEITGEMPDLMIPNEHRSALESLLYSHPNRAAADRVLASFVGR